MAIVSLSEGVLDIYAPKFGLDGLGSHGEKIVLKLTVVSGERKLTIFGSYAIGSRHAQISSDELVEFGPEVEVESVQRYTLRDLVDEVNAVLANSGGKGLFSWTREGVSLAIARSLLVVVKEFYTYAGRVYALLESAGKAFKVTVGSDGVELFDLQRRKLVGIVATGKGIVLKREFQHRQTAEASPEGTEEDLKS